MISKDREYRSFEFKTEEMRAEGKPVAFEQPTMLNDTKSWFCIRTTRLSCIQPAPTSMLLKSERLAIFQWTMLEQWEFHLPSWTNTIQRSLKSWVQAGHSENQCQQ